MSWRILDSSAAHTHASIHPLDEAEDGLFTATFAPECSPMDLPGRLRVGPPCSTRGLRYTSCRPCSNHLLHYHRDTAVVRLRNTSSGFVRCVLAPQLRDTFFERISSGSLPATFGTWFLTALANLICAGSATERFFIAFNLCGRSIVKI